MKFVACLIGLITVSVSAQMPGFDIYIAEINLQDSRLKVSHLKALTDRVEYDNQPFFMADGNSLLFTAAQSNYKTEQTDSIFVSLESDEQINLTNSTDSEYSPTLMPNGNSFSVIREINGEQKLWRYPLYPELHLSEPPSELLNKINPVGYHAWVDTNRVIMFVLGEPHSLQIADIQKQTSQILDINIGPSLFAIPDSVLMSYTASIGEGEDMQWQLKSYHPNTGKIAVLTTLPEGAYYYAWSGNDYAIAAVDGKLMQWDKGNPSNGWHQFADVSATCPKGVTRLTTNSQNTKIALVCTL